MGDIHKGFRGKRFRILCGFEAEALKGVLEFPVNETELNMGDFRCVWTNENVYKRIMNSG